MSKLFKILLWMLGGVAVLIALAATYNSLAPLPVYEVRLPENVTIPYGDSLALAQGARIVSMNCVICHRNQDGNLAGRPLPEKDFGDVYVANLTNHPKAGLGRYTDEELVHLIRTGIKPDGSQLLPFMTPYFKMSDEDLYSVIAYLRSDAPLVQPVEKYWPDNKLNFLAKALTRMVFKPGPMPEGPVPSPPLDDLVTRGKYLADAVFNCYQCHSASFETNNDHEPSLSEGYYGGGNPVGGVAGPLTISANLTMHPEYGLGEWTLDDFGKAIRQARRPDGRMLSSTMPPFTSLTDDEVAAIWAYLKTVPIQDNNAPSGLVQQ
jgi:mono/diheme cytochrome c family protein